MKIVIAGPMGGGHTHVAASHTAALVEALIDHDVYLQPTGIVPPLEHHELLTKTHIAPFDLTVVAHSSASMHIEETLYKTSEVTIAYVTHEHTKGWASQIVKRLRPFTIVVPSDEPTHRVLAQRQIKNLMAPSTTFELVDFIKTLAIYGKALGVDGSTP